MEPDDPTLEPRRSNGRFWWIGRVGIALIAFVVIAGTVFWFSRERIAGNLIDDALASSELEARYDIVSIGTQRQVIENFAIGDEDRPDLTIERIIAEVDYGLGAPQIGRITLINPRIYGSLNDGTLSFGALDPAIYGEGEGEIPALDVEIVDARGLIESDFGRIALKLDGEGMLDDGFLGKLAVTAPGFGTKTCSAQKATAYGDLMVQSGLPRFDGPVRLRNLACEGVQLASADIAAQLSTVDDFSKLEGAFVVDGKALGFADIAGDALTGKARLTLDSNSANLAHDLTLGGLTTPYGGLEKVQADGSFRSGFALAETEWSAEVSGQDFTPGDTATALVSGAKAGLSGTMLEPLLSKLTRNLDAQAKGASLLAAVTVRQNESGLAVIVPEGQVLSGAGDPLLLLSRVSWSPDGAARAGSLSGNFITGGAGLPQINGRMEQRGARAPLNVRVSMAEYAQGANRLAIPRFELRQDRAGNMRFNGIVNASGDIPGGSVQRLTMPVAGVWASGSALALGEGCLTARFDALTLYDLALQAQNLELCPETGARAMISYSDTLQVAINAQDLALEGELAGSPIRLASASGAIRYPAPFALSEVAVRIGNPGSGVDLYADTLEGAFGTRSDEPFVSGIFRGAMAGIDPVPLNFTQIAGDWRYSGEELLVDNAAITISDGAEGLARFNPLSAMGARFTLAGSDITANADLRHPLSPQTITRVDIDHNLDSGAGQALLDVPGVVFGQGLQPEDLSEFTKGVIAFANGVITGEGRVSWTEDNVTSGGKFSTDDFDFAAAFGPVDGVSGDVIFTDLLALTTAPDQKISIASVNPGIEVLDGNITFSLTNGQLVSVNDGRWPFMGGELILRPTEVDYSGTGSQRYVFEIIGLDAAKFVSQLELTNLSATGLFDGTIPVVFDEDGNGLIDGGTLISRQPGGNVSYVGELLYEDLGAMGNYAFQSLRSLDYNQMSIGLNGDLAGEIITSMTFDGVRQGEGASQNFVTKRLAKLPIRFNVNVRSQNFYQLATMVRSFWDPSLLGDPVNRGSLPGSDGTLELQMPLDDGAPSAPEAEPSELRRPDEPAVQLGESEENL